MLSRGTQRGSHFIFLSNFRVDLRQRRVDGAAAAVASAAAAAAHRRRQISRTLLWPGASPERRGEGRGGAERPGAGCGMLLIQRPVGRGC